MKLSLPKDQARLQSINRAIETNIEAADWFIKGLEDGKIVITYHHRSGPRTLCFEPHHSSHGALAIPGVVPSNAL